MICSSGLSPQGRHGAVYESEAVSRVDMILLSYTAGKPSYLKKSFFLNGQTVSRYIQHGHGNANDIMPDGRLSLVRFFRGEASQKAAAQGLLDRLTVEDEFEAPNDIMANSELKERSLYAFEEMNVAPTEQWVTQSEEGKLTEDESHKPAKSCSSPAATLNVHWQQEHIAQDIFFHEYVLKERATISSTYNSRK
ncbi:hypothetical protein M514_19794, partial [Trichuris suis]